MSDRPLAGVQVWIEQRDSAFTDTLGRFTLSAGGSGAAPTRELDNRPLPLDEFRAQMWRDFGAICSQGFGLWYYDMFDFYQPHPEFKPVVRECNAMLEWATRESAPPFDAEVALFFDEDAGWRCSKLHQEDFGTWSDVDAVVKAGLPHDIYFLDDIRHPNLPFSQYKVFVFQGVTISKAQVEAIKQRCAGRKVIFIGGNPGVGSPDYGDPAALLQEVGNPEVRGSLTESYMSGVAQAAGIVQRGSPGQVTYMGKGVAVVHRTSSNAATVTFRQPVDLVDPADTTRILARGATRWEAAADMNRTAVVFYRPVK